MEEIIKTLPSLLPEISIAVIFAILMMWVVRYMGEAHKEKTVEFIATLNNIEEKHSKAYDKLGQSIDLNTQMTREAKDATKEMRETMTQLLIHK